MPVKIFWNETAYRAETSALRRLESIPNVEIVGVDLAEPAAATTAVVAAKRLGVPVAVCAVAADPMEGFVGQIARVIGDQPVHEQRYVQLHALRDDRLMVNEQRPSENAQWPAIVKNAATLLFRIADVILVSSMADLHRWQTLSNKLARRFAFVPIEWDDTRPALTDGVTVYAPQSSRSALRFVELALEDRRVTANWMTAESADGFPRTRTVIAPQWWRPMQVASLAARGHIVVAPAHGAEERVSSVPYRPLDTMGLATALESGLASPFETYPRFIGSIADVEQAVQAARCPSTEGPLVSVIVRTYNRPHLLARALGALRNQTHANVEAIVVNNGGEDVGAVVAQACGSMRHQYIVRDGGGHISAAANTGARAAAGEFVGYLDDDDFMYPDHVARCVAALESTGADLAFTDSLAEYAEMDGERKNILGVQIFLDREFDRDEIFAQNFAPIHSIVHRKRLFDRYGYFDESLPVTDDWELWLRASSGSRYVHVDRVTVEYSWRFDPHRGNMTLTHQQHFVDAYSRITQRYADRVPDRVLLSQLQQRALAQQQERVTMLARHPERVRDIMLGQQLAGAVPVGRFPDSDE